MNGMPIIKPSRQSKEKISAKKRAVGCQWHFRSNSTKKSRILPEDVMDIFNQTCEKLCKSTTTSQYNLLKGQLEELAKKHPTLDPWIQWWYAH